jgi:hypothetical protein
MQQRLMHKPGLKERLDGRTAARATSNHHYLCAQLTNHHWSQCRRHTGSHTAPFNSCVSPYSEGNSMKLQPDYQTARSCWPAATTARLAARRALTRWQAETRHYRHSTSPQRQRLTASTGRDATTPAEDAGPDGLVSKQAELKKPN